MADVSQRNYGFRDGVCFHAGIVAAQWNGFGVSGVANGAKVFAVRTFSERGEVTQKTTIAGFKFLVDAAQANGTISDFSCWGQMATDVFAPGAEILSTVPTSTTAAGAYRDNTRFYPEATAQDNLLYGIDRFDTDASGVRFFDKNPALDTSAKEIGSRTTQAGFDDKSAMSFNVRSLAKSESFLTDYQKAENGSVFLAIPVESAVDAKWIGLRYAVNDSNKFGSGIASITCAKKDGGAPVQVDNYCVSKLGKGLTVSSNGSVYWSQWMPRSLGVDGYVKASNEAHEKYLKDSTSMDLNAQTGVIKYKDPGEITGLYRWNNGGKSYIIAEVGLGHPEVDRIDDSTTLYIDNVAVGNGGAFTGAYEEMAGTSMATPCVTGCLAVIAKDEPASSTLSPELCIDDAETETTSWSDSAIAASVVGLDNGTHVAKVVNAEGAVSRVLFSCSSDDAPGRPLYEQNHSLPLSLKEYADRETDRLHGAMVACNGKLYAMSALMDHDIAQDMWSYDIASDTWSFVELPKDYKHGDLQPGCLAAMKGKVYLTGSDPDGEAALWQYDTSTGEWSRVKVDGPVEPSCNTLLGRAVASDNKLYYYLHSNRQLEPGKLVRATCNADTQSMSVEDLTDAFNTAIGEKLSSYVNKNTAETLVDHFTIAGLSDGVAIIGSDKLGADTNIIKDSSTSATTPKTGDSLPAVTFGALAVLALAGLAGAMVALRRRCVGV